MHIYAWIKNVHFGIMENSARRSVPFIPQAHVHLCSFMNISYLIDLFYVEPCLNAITVENWEESKIVLFYFITFMI